MQVYSIDSTDEQPKYAAAPNRGDLKLSGGSLYSLQAITGTPDDFNLQYVHMYDSRDGNTAMAAFLGMEEGLPVEHVLDNVTGAVCKW